MQTAIACDTHSDYDFFIESMHVDGGGLFQTDIDLWQVYLDSFPPLDRQHHNCNTCKAFIRQFGGLATIDEDGSVRSAIWHPDTVPASYRLVVKTMAKAVEKANVTGVFLSSDRILGTPVTGKWNHYAAANPSVYRMSAMTANQAAAAKKEDYRNISRALGEFSSKLLGQVVSLLKSNSLYRSEKILGQAEWLFNLKAMTLEEFHQEHKKNLIWRAVASAPAGFCHPRSGMLGTLLDDLSSGFAFDDAAAKFKSKMHPLRYQRPTAAPSSGAIEAAEKLVERLGVARSLERRYATIEDIETIWMPKPGKKSYNSRGVFGHLKYELDEESPPIVANSGKITWVKFAKEVLPHAEKIELHLPVNVLPFAVFVTAVHEDSPVIFQWDNRVSWYVWSGGNPPGHFRLPSGWNSVKAVCLPPHAWDGKTHQNFSKSPSFIIDGAKETRNVGNAIFPETLKAEYHAIRKVVEAHSKKAKIMAVEGAHVIGLGIGSTVRVHVGGVAVIYNIDRWD